MNLPFLGPFADWNFTVAVPDNLPEFFGFGGNRLNRELFKPIFVSFGGALWNDAATTTTPPPRLASADPLVRSRRSMAKRRPGAPSGLPRLRRRKSSARGILAPGHPRLTTTTCCRRPQRSVMALDSDGTTSTLALGIASLPKSRVFKKHRKGAS